MANDALAEDRFRRRADIAIAVFAARESANAMSEALAAIRVAAADFPTTVDILVNGNAQLSDALAEIVRALPGGEADIQIRGWSMNLADKAAAWNTYVHDLWPDAEFTCFVDGYALLNPRAVVSLVDTLVRSPDTVYAATGIPSSGRSAASLAAQMTRHGGIHGNFYVLRRPAMVEIRRRGFRLPVGLYRTDGLLGAVLAYAFDPAANAWNAEAIVVDPRASWTFGALRWWHAHDWAVHARRMLRQARGILENLACKAHLAHERRAPESLPQSAFELITGWRERHPAEFWRACAANPLCWLAMRNLSATNYADAARGAQRVV